MVVNQICATDIALPGVLFELTLEVDVLKKQLLEVRWSLTVKVLHSDERVVATFLQKGRLASEVEWNSGG